MCCTESIAAVISFVQSTTRRLQLGVMDRDKAKMQQRAFVVARRLYRRCNHERQDVTDHHQL